MVAPGSAPLQEKLGRDADARRRAAGRDRERRRRRGVDREAGGRRGALGADGVALDHLQLEVAAGEHRGGLAAGGGRLAGLHTACPRAFTIVQRELVAVAGPREAGRRVVGQARRRGGERGARRSDADRGAVGLGRDLGREAGVVPHAPTRSARRPPAAGPSRWPTSPVAPGSSRPTVGTDGGGGRRRRCSRWSVRRLVAVQVKVGTRGHHGVGRRRDRQRGRRRGRRGASERDNAGEAEGQACASTCRRSRRTARCYDAEVGVSATGVLPGPGAHAGARAGWIISR